MAKIFITGSADGLGKLAASKLVDMGHQVILHVRNEKRANDALAALPGAAGVLVADLSSFAAITALAGKANAVGTFDAVIHNAGINRTAGSAITEDGLPALLVVNTLAPYLLTCLMHPPRRLIYLGSNMHWHGNADITALTAMTKNNAFRVSYSDTKLHDLMLSLAFARKWKTVYSNTVDPGWVPTRMGGTGAPDSLEQGTATQVWLAESGQMEAMQTGKYFHHRKPAGYLAAANDTKQQDNLLAFCAELTGTTFPV